MQPRRRAGCRRPEAASLLSAGRCGELAVVARGGELAARRPAEPGGACGCPGGDLPSPDATSWLIVARRGVLPWLERKSVLAQPHQYATPSLMICGSAILR